MNREPGRERGAAAKELSNEQKEKLFNFFARLRKLRWAYDKLSRATPTRQEALAGYNRALDKVLAALDDPALTELLDPLLAESSEQLQTMVGLVEQELSAKESSLLERELRLSTSFGFKTQEVRALVRSLRRQGLGDVPLPKSVADIRHWVQVVHESAAALLESSTKEPRKKKKRRKRDVGQGIASAIFGVGTITADVFLPLQFTLSYGLGAAALYQAMRDIVGKTPD